MSAGKYDLLPITREPVIAFRAVMLNAPGASSGTRTIIFDCKQRVSNGVGGLISAFDTCNMYDTTTGVVTVPKAGFYYVTYQIFWSGTFSSGIGGLSDFPTLNILYIDGSGSSGVVTQRAIQFSDLIWFNAGERFCIRYDPNSSNNPLGTSGGRTHSYFSAILLGDGPVT